MDFDDELEAVEEPNLRFFPPLLLLNTYTKCWKCGGHNQHRSLCGARITRTFSNPAGSSSLEPPLEMVSLKIRICKAAAPCLP